MSFCSSTANYLQTFIITHLAGQTCVWHGCKWNFAGPQIYLQPAKIKVSILGFRWNFWFVIESIACEDYLSIKIFHFKCVFIGQPVSEISKFLTAYIQLKP